MNGSGQMVSNRMGRFAPLLGAVMALATPALAQGSAADLLAAPCLAEVENVEALAASYEAMGWTRVETVSDQIAAREALSEPRWATIIRPRPFETAEDVLEFIQNAHRRSDIEFREFILMQRADGVIAGFEYGQVAARTARAYCIFAGNAFPEVAEALADAETAGTARQFGAATALNRTLHSEAPFERRDLFVMRLDTEQPGHAAMLQGQFAMIATQVAEITP